MTTPDAPSNVVTRVGLPRGGDVKVTEPGKEGGAFASVVSDNRGVVELMSSGRRRFFSDLSPGSTILIRADVLDRHVLTARASVQACTATYLRATYVGAPVIEVRQRQSVRVEMDHAVRIRWSDPAGAQHDATGRMIDLSATGCQFVLSEEVAIGSSVAVRLRLDRLIELTGVAVRTAMRAGKVSVGVHFENLSRADQESLRNFVQRRIKRAVT